MKKLTLVFVALVASTMAGQVVANDWKKIRIATEGAYKPWNFTDSSGKLVGFELDLAQDLCKRMGAECEIVGQAWDGIIPALEAGKYDAIMAGMSITEKRKKVIAFSRAYAATPARFVALKSSPHAKFTTSADTLTLDDISADEQSAIDAIVKEFKGKTIGVQTSTTHENFLREYLGKDADIKAYDTQENLDLDLQSGRVDVALASMSYWVPLLASDNGSEMLMVGPGMTGGPFGAGVGVGIRQKDADLAEKFSAAINAAIKDGVIEKLAVQWFGFDSSAH